MAIYTSQIGVIIINRNNNNNHDANVSRGGATQFSREPPAREIIDRLATAASIGSPKRALFPSDCCVCVCVNLVWKPNVVVLLFNCVTLTRTHVHQLNLAALGDFANSIAISIAKMSQGCACKRANGIINCSTIGSKSLVQIIQTSRVVQIIYL